MGQIATDTFICFDLETTGLDPVNDRIIEIAIVKFTFDGTIDSYETLIDPEKIISPDSIAIHNITQDMVIDKPKIQDLLPAILKKLQGHVIVGHSIKLDLDFIIQACKRYDLPNMLTSCRYIDTLRLARLYGQSPTNSLEKLNPLFVGKDFFNQVQTEYKNNFADSEGLLNANFELVTISGWKI